MVRKDYLQHHHKQKRQEHNIEVPNIKEMATAATGCAQEENQATDDIIERTTERQDGNRNPSRLLLAPSAELTATGQVPRWRIGKPPSDMKTSCETSRITLKNKQSQTNSSIVRRRRKTSLKILISTDPELIDLSMGLLSRDNEELLVPRHTSAPTYEFFEIRADEQLRAKFEIRVRFGSNTQSRHHVHTQELTTEEIQELQ
ncbi:hypothetical protein LAZ67_15001483 [Cordylochernes scorpioides]|uniref:Uncharacterized protein n=1 Tax=Cordylochernes scorpioides TaxID=51811 RepID=A0ABY6L8T5_9ARAC|nr:hypothetical protein LAZ67_15001483 [Cordylochernes scorpioides]